MMCDLFYVGEWQQQWISTYSPHAPQRAFQLNAHIFGFYAFHAGRDDKRADAYMYMLSAMTICIVGKCNVHTHNRSATLLR